MFNDSIKLAINTFVPIKRITPFKNNLPKEVYRLKIKIKSLFNKRLTNNYNFLLWKKSKLQLSKIFNNYINERELNAIKSGHKSFYGFINNICITKKCIPPLIKSTNNIVTSDIDKCEALLFHLDSVYIADDWYTPIFPLRTTSIIDTICITSEITRKYM